jgi:hypothetical protein
LLLWDRGFAKNSGGQDWDAFLAFHRCARIIFSLSFHLEKMTPQECVDLLINRVGHEADNAAGEVRRSFAGGLRPALSAAYLLGGMQIFSLHKELVDSGKMSNRDFHDTILRKTAFQSNGAGNPHEAEAHSRFQVELAFLWLGTCSIRGESIGNAVGQGLSLPGPQWSPRNDGCGRDKPCPYGLCKQVLFRSNGPHP